MLAFLVSGVCLHAGAASLRRARDVAPSQVRPIRFRTHSVRRGLQPRLLLTFPLPSVLIYRASSSGNPYSFALKRSENAGTFGVASGFQH